VQQITHAHRLSKWTLISIFLYKPPYRPTYKQYKFHTPILIPVAATVYSVQRVVTGWTNRGVNPGVGREFSPRPNRPRGPPCLVYKGYRVLPGTGLSAVLDIHLLLVLGCELLEIYLLLFSVPTQACHWVTFTLPPLGCGNKEELITENVSASQATIHNFSK